MIILANQIQIFPLRLIQFNQDLVQSDFGRVCIFIKASNRIIGVLKDLVDERDVGFPRL